MTAALLNFSLCVSLDPFRVSIRTYMADPADRQLQPGEDSR